MPPPRVYRYRPWLAATTVGALLMIVLAVPVVMTTVRDPALENVARTLLGLAPLTALGAFLLLSWRVRTTVDDDGITQHWITRSFRIPYPEITELESVQAGRRWFLRAHCGERTFEIVSCQVVIGPAFAGALGRPPRLLTAAHADIEQRWTSARPHPATTDQE